MAALAAGFLLLQIPLAVADRARFFSSWLRRIAPVTHQDQACGDALPVALAALAAPEKRWCRTVSNGFTQICGCHLSAPVPCWLTLQAIRF
jgi:hypothetical protein